MLYSYPSYLGAPIVKARRDYLPLNVLGMTDGRKITIGSGLGKEVAEFVLLHEEEHVKDMGASEREVDERALARFVSKNGRLTKNIRKLMKRRHGASGTEKHFAVKDDYYIEHLYGDFNGQGF